MIDFIIRNSMVLYFGAIIALVAAEVVMEQHSRKMALRTPTNYGLMLLNICVEAANPISGLIVAIFAAGAGYGLLNALDVPWGASVLLTFLALDGLYYGMHRVYHSGWLWRLHAVHHSDDHLDASSHFRIHPATNVINMPVIALFALAIGASPEGVLLFGIVSNVVQLFSHTSLQLPRRVDRWASYVVNTPNIHAIHHSADPADYDKNFCAVFTFWDRLGGTFQADSRATPGRRPKPGIVGLEGRDAANVDRLLVEPFAKRGYWQGGAPGETAAGRTETTRPPLDREPRAAGTA